MGANRFNFSRDSGFGVASAHYAKVVTAIKESVRLMQEIDEVIPGWPLP